MEQEKKNPHIKKKPLRTPDLISLYKGEKINGLTAGQLIFVTFRLEASFLISHASFHLFLPGLCIFNYKTERHYFSNNKIRF